jgi:riboflavin kinase/FMN adenylyltransferase
MHFTPGLAQLSAAEFITDVLAGEWKVKALLTGYDHRFGRGREDGFPEYRAYGAACGMDVLEAGRYGLGEMKVSSSEIRRLLAKGQVEGAAQMLGYPYCLKGRIVPGHKIGRTLGFPTANIRISEPFKMLPATGVYAVEAVLHGGRYHGMLYIGSRPTLNNGEAIPEVHIFGFTGEAYGSDITVSFLRYVRGDIRFASLDELKRQLERDKQSIISMLEDGE